jgi:hypothetical protein
MRPALCSDVERVPPIQLAWVLHMKAIEGIGNRFPDAQVRQIGAAIYWSDLVEAIQ